MRRTIQSNCFQEFQLGSLNSYNVTDPSHPRRQMVVDVLHPGKATVSKTDVSFCASSRFSPLNRSPAGSSSLWGSAWGDIAVGAHSGPTSHGRDRSLPPHKQFCLA
jgi:hypothetical protein